MALPVASLIKTAIQALYDAFADDATVPGTRQAVGKLNKLVGNLNARYGIPVDIALTSDADDADTAAFVTAESTMSAKTIYRTTVALFDFGDDAMGNAKGSAVAVGDVYVINTGGTDVVYLGNNSGFAFDFVSNQTSDFVSIGS